MLCTIINRKKLLLNAEFSLLGRGQDLRLLRIAILMLVPGD